MAHGMWLMVRIRLELSILFITGQIVRMTMLSHLKWLNFLGIESFAMDLITAGGNYMTTGEGISASSDLTWEENPTLLLARY